MSLRLKILFLVLICFFSLILLVNFYHGDDDHSFTSSNLPLVFINTKGKTITDEPKIKATMGIVWNGPGQRNAISDPKNDYNGNISIEIRGSTSQLFPKKSYGFETRATNLNNKDVSLLGLPHESDWILYGAYSDKTLIRDVLTYTLDASMGHYSPRCRYVELFMNGKYEGVYVLMEKIKRNKQRVDIAKLLPNDLSGDSLTGGYIIKIDKTTGSTGEGWYSDYINNTNHTFYQYEYPKSSDISLEQKNYIHSYIRSMEKALYAEKYTGTGSYHEFLNDSSFVDYLIINELSKNIDGYRLSSYLYKGKNDKMNCGPIWDFNFAYGNCFYYDGESPTGFVYQADYSGDKWQVPFWWTKLMQDQAFVQKVKTRWSEVRRHELSTPRINQVTDSLISLLSEARVRNYKRWKKVIGKKVGPNYYVGPTYDAEVLWMKNWITQRLAFLDKQWRFNLAPNENLQATKADRIIGNSIPVN